MSGERPGEGRGIRTGLGNVGGSAPERAATDELGWEMWGERTDGAATDELGWEMWGVVHLEGELPTALVQSHE
jgi:hypothetical protein